MIQEIPYGIYEQNKNIDNLPISLEVIPHKAILITNAHVINQSSRNDLILNIYKCVFITFFSIPIILVLISFFVRMP